MLVVEAGTYKCWTDKIKERHSMLNKKIVKKKNVR